MHISDIANHHIGGQTIEDILSWFDFDATHVVIQKMVFQFTDVRDIYISTFFPDLNKYDKHEWYY